MTPDENDGWPDSDTRHVFSPTTNKNECNTCLKHVSDPHHVTKAMYDALKTSYATVK